jgi:hypothetical protein
VFVHTSSLCGRGCCAELQDVWMLPILSEPAVAAASDLAIAIDGLLQRVDDIPLPGRDLDGWASLCAGEYRDAVQRLSRQLARIDAALRAARSVLAS